MSQMLMGSPSSQQEVSITNLDFVIWLAMMSFYLIEAINQFFPLKNVILVLQYAYRGRHTAISPL